MVSAADGLVTISTRRFTIEGKSRAGNETFFRVRELGIALDIGRCPDMIIGTRDVFITHAHLDHALGVPFYAAQRNLQSLPPGNVYVPAEAAEGFQQLMKVHEALENTTYEMNLIGVGVGQTIELRRPGARTSGDQLRPAAGELPAHSRSGLAVLAHRAPHRVVANAYEFLERRHKLRGELQHLAGPEIAEMRRQGLEVEQQSVQSLLFYTGDTDRGILESGDAIFRSEVLMIECSFTGPHDQDKAAIYRHIHLDDIFEFAGSFENELIVLTHFSLRDAPREIHERLSGRCPESLRDRIRLVLPEPFSSLTRVS